MSTPSIWFTDVDLDALNSVRQNTLVGTLGIKVTEIGADYLRGTMPVEPRVHQPFGILHGGASVALAETLGSMAAMMTQNPATHHVVGLDINANHLKAVRSGIVTGTARPLHTGRTTHVWQINLRTEDGALICVSRLTVAILKRSA